MFDGRCWLDESDINTETDNEVDTALTNDSDEGLHFIFFFPPLRIRKLHRNIRVMMEDDDHTSFRVLHNP